MIVKNLRKEIRASLSRARIKRELPFKETASKSGLDGQSDDKSQFQKNMNYASIYVFYKVVLALLLFDIASSCPSSLSIDHNEAGL